jgi:hypothetical protein
MKKSEHQRGLHYQMEGYYGNKYDKANGREIAIIKSDEILIGDVQSSLGFCGHL